MDDEEQRHVLLVTVADVLPGDLLRVGNEWLIVQGKSEAPSEKSRFALKLRKGTYAGRDTIRSADDLVEVARYL